MSTATSLPSRWVRGLALLLLAAGLHLPAAAQSTLADIHDLYPGDVRTDGFVLDSEQAVEIVAYGPETRRDGFSLSNAWILDARTRRVMWDFEQARTHDRNRGVREVRETLTLPAGAYEVYYASFPNGYYNDRWHGTNSLGDVIRNIAAEIRDDWDRDWDGYDRDERRQFGVTITGNGTNERNLALLSKDFVESAVLRMTDVFDDRYHQQGFTLSQGMDLEVYAIGEMRRDETFDYGWIINTETRERVWVMNWRNTDPAGGAEKNRVANEVLRLPAGTYAAFFVTDGSHSTEEWNSAPPYDPMAWGLTLLPTDPADARHFELVEYEDVPLRNTIVEMRRMRDDAYESKSFTLKRPMRVRIYAMGEGVRGEMYDYGWLRNAETREEVWRMRYYDTEHAGGGEKNRLFDEVLELPAGSYTAYYVTDGSHSFRDWNDGAPFDQESWGLTILPADDNFNPADVAEYTPGGDGRLIAEITRVRDDAFRRERFKLDESTRVQIYALGEGSRGNMYDYGWIEDRRGRVIWEMTYRMTDPAGGADKNRLVDTVITLEAGEYTLFYETDGSHDFGDWNARRPHDPEAWGITLRRAD